MTPIRAAAPALAALFLATSAIAAEFEVTPIVIEETKAVFGKVESRDSVLARARIGGTVREIRVDEGSVVKEGDIVAIIVDDKLAIQQQAADARLQALTSQLTNARTELARAEELIKSGATTQSRVDLARTQGAPAVVLMNKVRAGTRSARDVAEALEQLDDVPVLGVSVPLAERIAGAFGTAVVPDPFPDLWAELADVAKALTRRKRG